MRHQRRGQISVALTMLLSGCQSLDSSEHQRSAPSVRSYYDASSKSVRTNLVPTSRMRISPFSTLLSKCSELEQPVEADGACLHRVDIRGTLIGLAYIRDFRSCTAEANFSNTQTNSFEDVISCVQVRATKLTCDEVEKVKLQGIWPRRGSADRNDPSSAGLPYINDVCTSDKAFAELETSNQGITGSPADLLTATADTTTINFLTPDSFKFLVLMCRLDQRQIGVRLSSFEPFLCSVFTRSLQNGQP